MKISTLLIPLITFSLTPHHLFASEPFDFVSDVIRSFESCKIAGEHIKDNDAQDIVSEMKDIRIFANEIRQANSMVVPHTQSKNELIRKSANNFSTIYSSIVTNNEQLLSFLEETLNNPKEAASKQGTSLRKLSEHMAANEELWRMLPYATTMTTYTLVGQNRTEAGTLRFLTITGVERDSLRSNLRRVFGDGITTGTTAGLLPIDASAALLWEFLAKPWKPADAN